MATATSSHCDWLQNLPGSNYIPISLYSKKVYFHAKLLCASSKMSWNLEILFLRYNQTKQIVSFVSYCLFNLSTVCIFGTTKCPISLGFFTKLKPKQYPNRKCQKKKNSYFPTWDSFCLIASELRLLKHESSVRNEA